MLEIYSLDQSEKWDSIVRSFAQFDIYYLSGYVKAFKIHGDGEPLLFYYNGKDIRGINVVMKRDIADDKYFANFMPKENCFDFATPYGYGGWLIEGSNLSELFAEYEAWCVKNSIVSEFVRFHPLISNNSILKEYYETVVLGNTVTMSLASPEIIWANITSKNRNVIRKARKNGVKIYNGRHPSLCKKFKAIYDKTMDKDHAQDYYYFRESFYDSIIEDLPQNAQIFYAEYDEKIIAAAIILAANGKLSYHLSGSVKEYSYLAPTNLLLYEVALWGCENKYETLHLGGGVGSKEDSLFKFKKAFYRGDDYNSYCIGKKIFIGEKYDELVTIRNNCYNTGFFPQYRG